MMRWPSVDRLPLLIMIAVSIGFGIFPMHLYNVVRSGVDPLMAKITHVVPVAAAERSRREAACRPCISSLPTLRSRRSASRG